MIPDYLPVLCKGASGSPKHGGCLMQITNWFANPRRWDDGTGIVHDTLRAYAIAINDCCNCGNRPALALLAPRLIGTSRWNEDGEVNQRLAEWIVNHPVHKDKVRWFTAMIDEFDRITGRESISDFPREDWDRLAQHMGTK